MKKYLKSNKYIRYIYSFLNVLILNFQFRNFKNIIWYVQDLKNLRKNNNFQKFELYPCINDKTKNTPLDPTYFFQDSWAAKKIFDLKPVKHVDIGSSAKTIGILSQFTPITMVDIRPLTLSLPNLNFVEGSILKLPFADNSIDSISSLCVVEHIGLGRYGDPLDAFGSEKAVTELQRVVSVGGYIIFSVPIDSNNTIYFNAHRAFTRSYILELFSKLELIEEKYHYGNELIDSYAPARGFGTGLFMFKKVYS